MHVIKKYRVALASLLIMAGMAHSSSEHYYQCTVESIVSPETTTMESNQIGKKFTIERRTGQMISPLIFQKTVTSQVIDYGSNKASYKVVMQKSKSSSIYTLTINEFDVGTTKSFILQKYNMAYLGWCKHT